nr:helix-turn-helix domain-containing protein [Ligilactobacillus hayakitensis]
MEEGLIMQANAFTLCPKFSKTFSILGRKWNGLIIDVLLQEGPQRFRTLADKVDKCSDRVMVERLKELEAENLVERVSQNDSSRVLYQLTSQGEDLREVMKAIHTWSDQWYSIEDCQ